MNMYEAILETADHIEAHPEKYNSGVTDIPTARHGQGCMLGRLAQICGYKKRQITPLSPADSAAQALLGVCFQEFFRRIGQIMYEGFGVTPDNNDVALVVPALRRYAQLYRAALEAPKPTPEPEPIPKDVLEIFNVSQFQTIFAGAGHGAPTKKLQYNINTDTVELVT